MSIVRLTFLPETPEDVPSPHALRDGWEVADWLERLAARALQGDQNAAHMLDHAGVSHAALAPIYRRLMVGGLS